MTPDACPTCGVSLTDPGWNELKVYRWDGVTATYCTHCDTADHRKLDAPKLTTADIAEATERVVRYEWKKDSWRIYLNVGGTPGCISFPTKAIAEAASGNPTPLEWRIEEEFERRVDLADDTRELVELWLDDPERHDTAGGSCEVGLYA